MKEKMQGETVLHINIYAEIVFRMCCGKLVLVGSFGHESSGFVWKFSSRLWIFTVTIDVKRWFLLWCNIINTSQYSSIAESCSLFLEIIVSNYRHTFKRSLAIINSYMPKSSRFPFSPYVFCLRDSQVVMTSLFWIIGLRLSLVVPYPISNLKQWLGWSHLVILILVWTLNELLESPKAYQVSAAQLYPSSSDV